MTELKGNQFEGKEQYVEEVFDNIASCYDKFNNISTFGMVKGWQKFVIKKSNIKPGEYGLDVGTGTGEMAFMMAEAVGKDGRVDGVDLTPGMLEVARQKEATLNLPTKINFKVGSALELPYAENSVDAVISGFMLRNVTDLDLTMREMCRVVRPGRNVVCLEMSKPKNAVVRWGFHFYFRRIAPIIGHFFDKNKSIEGRQSPYNWLRDSIEGFPYGDDMVKVFENAGLTNVKYYPKSLGATGVYVGTKPLEK